MVQKRRDPLAGDRLCNLSTSDRNTMIPHRADRPCMSKARTVSGMALVPGDTEDLRTNGASRLPALN